MRFDISDNGPGISQGEEEMIFERFRQSGNTLTDKPKGTGLGLPISREIVQLFGGRLWAEANVNSVGSEGKMGAHFAFTIPLAPRLSS